MYTVDNSRAVYCIGSKDEYTSLLNCKKIGLIEEEALEYFGESLPERSCVPQKVLLMNLDINNISICIKKKVKFLSFFYKQHIITDDNQEYVLNLLETQNVNIIDYSLMKQINIIRMVFDIRKEAVVLSSLPVHIQIEHTTFCNARCIMCDHYIAHNRGSKHLKLSTLQVLESLFPYVTNVIMHGNGEPLLNPEILQIFDLYKKYHIKTSLNTNLSYLNDELLKAIRENCASIHVSCDGSNKDQYETIRQGLTYSNFISNLKKLSDSCPDTEKVLEIVMMRQNIRNAEDFVKFGYEYGFKKVIFNALGCNKWIGNEKDNPYNYSHTTFYHCLSAKELGLKTGIQVVTPFDDVYDTEKDILDIDAEYSSPESSEILHKKYQWYTNTIAVRSLKFDDLLPAYSNFAGSSFEGICEYPFAKSYIDVDGRVSFCCPASRKIVDVVSYDNSFMEIWNKEAYQKLRENFYKGTLPRMCDGCYFMKNKSLKFFQ